MKKFKFISFVFLWHFFSFVMQPFATDIPLSWCSEIRPVLPFYLYSESLSVGKYLYVPSGWMGDVYSIRFFENWKDESSNGERTIRFVFDRSKAGVFGWAGVAWQYPACNWGNIDGAVNLSGAKKLCFRARGEAGGEVVAFKIGGNYGVFSDTTEKFLGPLSLSKDWKEYSLSLEQEDLSHVSWGFAFFVNKYQQPRPVIIFYLKDIRLE
jgi:hypothetical protein